MVSRAPAAYATANKYSPEIVANGPGMPVVLYLRKSNKTGRKTADETISVQDQRRDLIPFCEARRWQIVREYVDDGKSASRNDHKRVNFHRMLADVERLGDFRAVVVWDLSRLTRKNSIEAADAAKVMMSSGILVVSSREGELDLNTTVGRTMWTLHTEGNSEFAKKISDGVTKRGRPGALRRGNWPHGRIPYGYDRQYWDGNTLIVQQHRNAPASKAKTWATKIVPNEVEGPIAARIIRDFARRDISIRGLAMELTREGVAPPIEGGMWKPENIKTLIRCPAYIGSTAIGYSYRQNYEAHARCEPQQLEGGCPAVIDRRTWERANKRLAEQADTTHRVQTGKASPLSGIVICGGCGARMSKNTKKGVTRFSCPTSGRNAAATTCRQWVVREDDLLDKVNEVLATEVDFAILREISAKPPENQAANLDTLKVQAETLGKQVTKAARNLALVDDENRAEVEKVLTELRSEREKVLNTIHLIETAADKSELERIARWWAENRPSFVPITKHDVKTVAHIDRKTFLAGLDESEYPRGGAVGYVADHVTADPDAYRDLLKRLNTKLTVHFAPKGKRYSQVEWCRFEARIDGKTIEHSMDATGRVAGRAPTARPCASRSPGRARCRPGGSPTGRRTPAWTRGSSSSTAS